MDITPLIDFFIQYVLPVLDIALLTFIIYKGYQILLQTRAIQLIKGVVTLVAIYFLAFFLPLNTLRWFFESIGTPFIIGIAIIFQPEIRKIFTRLGQGNWFKLSSQTDYQKFESVINSVEVLSDNRQGSLIVLSRNVGLKNIIETGTKMDAELSSSLILSIFSSSAPLHDGAIVIQDGKIVAAGCFLPLSEQVDIRKSFGTRHRAALGLAEETDAVTIVVSEENGAISLAYDANLIYELSISELSKRLYILFEYSYEEEEEEIEV